MDNMELYGIACIAGLVFGALLFGIPIIQYMRDGNHPAPGDSREVFRAKLEAAEAKRQSPVMSVVMWVLLIGCIVSGLAMEFFWRAG